MNEANQTMKSLGRVNGVLPEQRFGEKREKYQKCGSASWHYTKINGVRGKVQSKYQNCFCGMYE
jgi:hypothetical protein